MVGQQLMPSLSQNKEQEDLQKQKSRRGKSSRLKGNRNERELFGLLSERLGTAVRRNLSQTRGGGADTLDIPGWSLEVKRHESGFRQEWWTQTLKQADAAGKYPALAYRASRQPWRFRVWLESINDKARGGMWAEVDLDTFCYIVRESL